MSDERDWVDQQEQITKDLIIPCVCQHSVWRIGVDEYSLLYVYSYADRRMSILDRLKAAVKYFWSEESPCDDIIISEEDAKRLLNFLKSKYEIPRPDNIQV